LGLGLAAAGAGAVDLVLVVLVIVVLPGLAFAALLAVGLFGALLGAMKQGGKSKVNTK
jgi:hypothetical protein